VHARLVEVARTLRNNRSLACEVIYVDDGSRDDTLAIAQALPASALDVQVVSLSRNFGKEAALLAGLHHARLGAVLFIDGDGQHPPALIGTLVGHWLDDGYDVVYTAKAHRAHESVARRLLVKSFYLLVNWGARTKIPEDAGDFRLLSPRAANALRQLPERNRFFKGLSSWIGFRQIRIDYEPDERVDGRTTWNLVIALAAFVYGAQIVYETLVYDVRVPGYPSLFVGVMVLGGVQLIMLGVVGEYIGKILNELKGRPVYFVAEHALKPREEENEPASDTRTAAE
jgi:glycosyltransferase involved in cell wall biosynthesis